MFIWFKSSLWSVTVQYTFACYNHKLFIFQTLHLTNITAVLSLRSQELNINNKMKNEQLLQSI